MSGFFRSFRFAASAVVVAGGLIVASCSSGLVNTTPVAQPTNAPSNTQTIPTGGGSLSVPAAANGQVATFNVAAGAPAGVSFTSSSSATAPSGAPAPSSLKRTAQAVSGAVPFFYVTFTVSGSIASSFITNETVTLQSSNPATASYYVEFDDITSSPATKLGCAGPGSVANLVATIANGTSGGACSNTGSGSPTLVPGHTYIAQFYYIAAVAPTSSPTGAAPTASPTSLPLFTLNSGSDSTSCTTTCTVPLELGDNTSGLATITFGTPSNSGTIQGTWADSTANTTPSGFPAFTGTGTVQLYGAVIDNVSSITFAQTPTVDFEFPGTTTKTTCSLDAYGNGQWNTIASGAVSANATRIMPVTTQVMIGQTPSYVAIVCN